MPLRPLPVLLDAGPAVHQSAGLYRYTTRLAAALERNCADTTAVRLFYNQHSDHSLPAPLAHFPTQSLRLGQYAWRLSVLASQLSRMPYWPVQRQIPTPGLFHATEHLLPRLTAPTVMTVHDLIFERYPEHHKATNRAFLRVGMPLFVRAATHIIAVSEHTARDLHELYQVTSDKVTVVGEGVEENFQPAPEATINEIRVRYSPERPYLLMVGTLEPRKNHRLALQALAQLKARGYPHRLVVAGGKGWLFEPIAAQVAELGLSDDVSFTGYVPDVDLPGLYSAAAALLMPSLYEGFGFPLLEAMACGTPVICARASSLPELAGDAALLVDTDDAEALKVSIAQLLDHPDLAATLRTRGLLRARQYTWEAAARSTAELYQEVASRYAC